jgi:predicted RNase H-like nuclease
MTFEYKIVSEKFPVTEIDLYRLLGRENAQERKLARSITKQAHQIMKKIKSMQDKVARNLQNIKKKEQKVEIGMSQKNDKTLKKEMSIREKQERLREKMIRDNNFLLSLIDEYNKLYLNVIKNSNLRQVEMLTALTSISKDLSLRQADLKKLN